MVDGLHQAVEAQVLDGDGLGENLTGLANTSGIQTQALVTNPILTARAAITKVEVLGYSPYYCVINPQDWETVETAQLDAGQYVLNVEGSRNGVPVDMATRRLWGVPVTVSTGVPTGTGWHLCAPPWAKSRFTKTVKMPAALSRLTYSSAVCAPDQPPVPQVARAPGKELPVSLVAPMALIGLLLRRHIEGVPSDRHNVCTRS